MTPDKVFQVLADQALTLPRHLCDPLVVFDQLAEIISDFDEPLRRMVFNEWRSRRQEFPWHCPREYQR